MAGYEIDEEFAQLEIDTDAESTGRPLCQKCKRPLTVCWCPYLPRDPISIRTTVYILQHPFEESRCLKTAPMLQYSLSEGKCQIFKGKRFSPERHPELADVLKSPNTVLLYPGSDAVNICDLNVDGDTSYNLVLLDGTWAQAKNLYVQNRMIKWPKQVQINLERKSKYVIRTQPTDGHLSTLETAAVALSILERNPDLEEILTKPLEALCRFQLERGAETHHSREYKIENGLWTKQLKKSVIRKMQRENQ